MCVGSISRVGVFITAVMCSHVCTEAKVYMMRAYLTRNYFDHLYLIATANLKMMMEFE